MLAAVAPQRQSHRRWSSREGESCTGTQVVICVLLLSSTNLPNRSLEPGAL